MFSALRNADGERTVLYSQGGGKAVSRPIKTRDKIWLQLFYRRESFRPKAEKGGWSFCVWVGGIGVSVFEMNRKTMTS